MNNECVGVYILLFAKLFHLAGFPNVCQQVLGTNGKDIVEFWDALSPADDTFWGHPALDTSKLDCMIPWASYADGVPCSRQGSGNVSMYACAHRPLLSKAMVRDQFFLSFVCPAHITIKKSKNKRGNLTLDPLYREFVNGLNEPRDYEEAQCEFLGGARALTCVHTGDQDWSQNIFELPHTSNKNPCARCPCGRMLHRTKPPPGHPTDPCYASATDK